MKFNKIYNMDCMEGMGKFPDKYFDLAIVDPPYGLGASTETFMRKGKQTGKSICKSGMNYTHKKWDSNKPNKKYFDELFRICKNIIVWGGNYFGDYLGATSCWIVWDKKNGDNLYSDCELAWTSFDSGVRKIGWRWHGMLQQNMKYKDVRIHPTQKPVALYRWILKNYAKTGWKILDTHVGSGSSLIACAQEGFQYIGFEIDKDYYDAACKRMKEVLSQTELFK